MITRIHVNTLVIRSNMKHNTRLPAVRVQQGQVARYCDEVNIKGPSKMVYRPDKPLPCGAKVWIETEAEVELIGEAGQ